MKKKTKQLKKICFIIMIGIILISSDVFAQGNTFKLDGNNNGTSNSKFGFTNNADLRLITNDSVRQIITRDGNVFIEKNLIVKGTITMSNLFPDNGKFEFSENTIFNKNLIVKDSLNVLGRLAVGSGTLILDPFSDFTGQPNNIYTDNGNLNLQSIAGSSFNTILNANGNTGNVGIGTSSPAYKLDVIDNINVRTTLPNQGYRINNNVVLQNPGLDNIFVGVGAGVNNAGGIYGGAQNTLIGRLAGFSNTYGYQNTATGYQALYSNTGSFGSSSGSFNTAMEL